MPYSAFKSEQGSAVKRCMSSVVSECGLEKYLPIYPQVNLYQSKPLPGRCSKRYGILRFFDVQNVQNTFKKLWDLVWLNSVFNSCTYEKKYAGQMRDPSFSVGKCELIARFNTSSFKMIFLHSRSCMLQIQIWDLTTERDARIAQKIDDENRGDSNAQFGAFIYYHIISQQYLPIFFWLGK